MVTLSEITVSIFVAVIAAILASYLTYFYSVGVARKSKLHEAKLNAYGDIVSLYQESLLNMDNLLALKEVEASNTEAFIPNLMNLMSELVGLGDTETLMVTTDPKRLEKILKEKGTRLFIEGLVSRAAILSSAEMAHNFKRARMASARMLLVDPPESVRTQIRRVQGAVATGGLIILSDVMGKNEELFIGIEPPTKTKTPDEWRRETEELVNELLQSMQIDLGVTL